MIFEIMAKSQGRVIYSTLWPNRKYAVGEVILMIGEDWEDPNRFWIKRRGSYWVKFDCVSRGEQGHRAWNEVRSSGFVRTLIGYDIFYEIWIQRKC